MTDEEFLREMANLTPDANGFWILDTDLERLLALARRGAAVLKSKELIKTFVDGSPLDREDATLLFEHLESLYLEQKP